MPALPCLRSDSNQIKWPPALANLVVARRAGAAAFLPRENTLLFYVTCCCSGERKKLSICTLILIAPGVQSFPLCNVECSFVQYSQPDRIEKKRGYVCSSGRTRKAFWTVDATSGHRRRTLSADPTNRCRESPSGTEQAIGSTGLGGELGVAWREQTASF